MDNNQAGDAPIIPASQSLPEITFRVLVLGFILTIILAAANAYLGLKVGLTVSASIPAAVISMSILRFFRNSNILENTMVQIMASVGEALTAGIAFILPALIIMHIWDKFNYWQTVVTSLLGGGLGVLFTIPLRRALLRDKSLRYPEAVAIAAVLKASTSPKKGDLNALVQGGFIGAAIGLLQSGFQILADNLQFWVNFSGTIFGIGLGFSPALIAAGYIVGVNVAISTFLGVIIGWIIGVPVIAYTYGLPAADTVNDMAMLLWRDHIRYIGVGTMLIGGLWTLCTLFKPVIQSMGASMSTLKAIKQGTHVESVRTERDIPINYVFIGGALLLIPIFLLIFTTIIPTTLDLSASFRSILAGMSTIYILFAGFVFCSIMAYFAGLIGSSNSPVSGMLVSALLLISLIFMLFFKLQPGLSDPSVVEMLGSVVAIGSMVVIGAALSISNDTMQDLKVGEIVGATPWKQQVMLILGVIVASFVIPPILQLLYNAYGIGGVFPHPGMDPSQMLSAPQAGLMATVAKGVFSHELQWNMIGVGALIAVACVIVDEFLKANYGMRLPVLAVGIGIYLPVDTSMAIVVGGFLSYIVHHKLYKMYRVGVKEEAQKLYQHQHRGLLIACGLVAGASLMGVVLAIPFAIEESTDAWKIMPDQFMSFTGILSLIVTFLLCAWIYRSVVKKR